MWQQTQILLVGVELRLAAAHAHGIAPSALPGASGPVAEVHISNNTKKQKYNAKYFSYYFSAYL
jgi:hypothetical protein